MVPTHCQWWTSVSTLVTILFCGVQNFEPSCWICPFSWHLYVLAEFGNGWWYEAKYDIFLSGWLSTRTNPKRSLLVLEPVVDKMAQPVQFHLVVPAFRCLTVSEVWASFWTVLCFSTATWTTSFCKVAFHHTRALRCFGYKSRNIR